MNNYKSDIIYKKWWRHIDGKVSFDDGFQFDKGDYWYFDIDPNEQIEPISEEGDSRLMHQDHLFDNERDALSEAIEFVDKNIIYYNNPKTLLLDRYYQYMVEDNLGG